MSLLQWLIALPVWGAGVSIVPIIGIIKDWPIWLLATVSAIVAFLWLTIVTWFVRLYRPTARQEARPVHTINTANNSAVVTENGTVVNAPGAGQVIGKIEAGRDVIINPSSSVMTQPDGREFVGVTPDDLTRFFRDDQTTIQSSRAVEPFIGKWMKVEGDLGDVGSSFYNSVNVTFVTYGFTGELGRYKRLYMRFNGKKWVDSLYLLTKGTHIVVKGQIKDISSMSVTLDNCELSQ